MRTPASYPPRNHHTLRLVATPARRLALAAALALLSPAAGAIGKQPLPAKYEKSPYALMSLSVGAPNSGYQLRAKRLRNTPSLRIKSNSRRRNYGHPALVLMLRRSASDVEKASPNSRMLVGDLSYKHGGAISKHRSHQSGRDADVGFYVRDANGKQLQLDRFIKIDGKGQVIGMRNAYFDEHRNWLLVRSWLRDRRAGISHVFVAAHIRKRLLDFARSNQAARRYYDAAARFLKQPSNSSLHDDHYHVRIDCPERQKDICVQHAISD